MVSGGDDGTIALRDALHEAPLGLRIEATNRTVEGLAVNGGLNPIQAALEACDAVQCGMCFPGMVVTLTHLLRTKPGATRDDIRSALTGNICRCTGYERIVEAALLAVTANDRGRIHV